MKGKDTRILIVDTGNNIEINTLTTISNEPSRTIKVTVNTWNLQKVKALLEQAYEEAGYEVK